MMMRQDSREERSSTMSRQHFSKVVITVILVISFLVGCGESAPTAVSEVPAATSTSEQSTDTPTVEAPEATPTATSVPPTFTPSPPAQSDAEIALYEGAELLESGTNVKLDKVAQELIDKAMGVMKTMLRIDTTSFQSQASAYTLPTGVTDQDLFTFYLSAMPENGWQLAHAGVTDGSQFFDFITDQGDKIAVFVTKEASAETDNMPMMVIIVLTK
jgi:hypothetical protein